MKLNTLPPVAIMLALSVGGIAVAEPVNVEISGNTRIRGNYFDMDSIGDTRFIQQNTRVSIKVDFTSDVSAVGPASNLWVLRFRLPPVAPNIPAFGWIKRRTSAPA